MDLRNYDGLLSQYTENPELINKIAELARALTPISEIAALLDLNEEILRMVINDKSSPVRLAYMKAKAQTALELRKNELELAKVGAPLAVQLTSNYLKDMTADEL